MGMMWNRVNQFQGERNVNWKERFWLKVLKIKNCWEWQGTILDNGYGAFHMPRPNQKMIYAHRLSWEIHFGKIPKDKIVGHKCDNKICVNPEHLFVGTQRENIEDSLNKGRHSSQNRPRNKDGTWR